MAVPISAIETQIRNWVVAASGLAAANVIFANQNGPEPNGKYIVINCKLAAKRQGIRDEVVWDGTIATPKYTVYSHRRVMGSINCYGNDAFETLSAVQDGLMLPARQAALDAALLTVWTEDIRDLTGLKGALTEERAQMNFYVLCGSSASTDTSIAAFDSVQYSSDADHLDLPETTIST